MTYHAKTNGAKQLPPHVRTDIVETVQLCVPAGHLRFHKRNSLF